MWIHRQWHRRHARSPLYAPGVTEFGLDLGDWIAEQRIRAQFTQEALAVAIGLDQASISRIESGDRRLQFDEFARICAALDVASEEVAKVVDIQVRRAKGPQSIWERESGD